MGGPLLARWHTDWDCGYETNWWYVIKDTPFDLSKLKSKRRYEINKGRRNFAVREINPSECSEALYKITAESYKTYPVAYRPSISHDAFVEEVAEWNFYKTYGAFSVENGEMCGYAILRRNGNYVDFRNLKSMPDMERLGVNAAIIYEMLTAHEDFLRSGGYVCDGSRNILHETKFQDYLEKYFEFRKAYCKLRILYRPWVKAVLETAYPFRAMLQKADGFPLIHKLNGLLKMEEIRRTFQ